MHCTHLYVFNILAIIAGNSIGSRKEEGRPNGRPSQKLHLVMKRSFKLAYAVAEAIVTLRLQRVSVMLPEASVLLK